MIKTKNRKLAARRSTLSRKEAASYKEFCRAFKSFGQSVQVAAETRATEILRMADRPRREWPGAHDRLQAKYEGELRLALAEFIDSTHPAADSLLEAVKVLASNAAGQP